MNVFSLASLTSVCAVALLAGCASPPPPPPPPPVYMTTSALGTELTANVVGTAETESDRAMLDAFSLAVRNELTARGYRLEADDPDVLVELKVSENVLDRSGRNVTLSGTFSLVVTTPVRRGIRIGVETFAVQSEQSLGEDAARADLVRLVLPRVRRWIGTNALPADTGLGAVVVNIVGAELDPADDARVAAAFAGAAGDAEGVLRVGEISRDPEARRYRYRVVYVNAKFPTPAGFLGAILAAHPELPLTPVN